MLRLLLILSLIALLGSKAAAQVITVDNLLSISTLSEGRVDNYMHKKGYLPGGPSQEAEEGGMRFNQKPSRKKKAPVSTITRNVDIYRKSSAFYCELKTTSHDEFIQGKQWLKNAGFIFDKQKDSLGSSALIFQKAIYTIWTDSIQYNEDTTYKFVVERKELPDPTSIHFAEDLTAFNSNEQLTSYFGLQNVKKDVYFWSEKELRKCSILFPNTNRQAIFVWDDQPNLRKLSYVLISGIAPTIDAVMYSQNVGQNRWTSRIGLNAGMSLRELVRRNGEDFKFYGPSSEFAYMVEPLQNGNIDFKKTGIMLGCLDCSSTSSLNEAKVSAEEAIEKGMTLYIFYIMISP